MERGMLGDSQKGTAGFTEVEGKMADVDPRHLIHQRPLSKGNLEFKGEKATAQSDVDTAELVKNTVLLFQRNASLQEIRASINLEQNQSEGRCDFLLDNLAGEEKKNRR